MRLAHLSRVLAVVAALALPALFAGCADRVNADQLTPQLQAARTALEKYQDPFAAIRDGYLSTVGCINFTSGGTMNGMPYPAGAMGVHFVNFALVGPKLDPAKPQVLLYEKDDAGKLHLTGAEWFMPYSKGMQPPVLFGHKFYGPMYGHYPAMPKNLIHYDLHVWLWKPNPAGIFSPTNANVKCPATGYTFTYAHPDMPAMTH